MNKVNKNEQSELAYAWWPFLNVMQRLNVIIDAAQASKKDPQVVRIGRKENYELKRDWRSVLEFASDGTYKLHGLRVEVVDETEWVEVV